MERGKWRKIKGKGIDEIVVSELKLDLLSYLTLGLGHLLYKQAYKRSVLLFCCRAINIKLGRHTGWHTKFGIIFVRNKCVATLPCEM